MAQVSLKGVNKSFGATHVIKDVDLEIEKGEFVVFVGPSGCGKSTLLRLIAGLETLSSGEIMIADRAIMDLPPSKRGIAMVFQSYALYPHMTVFHNMAFSLELQGVPKKEIAERVESAAKILQMEHLLSRRPAALSGGQRQRVAIGRAIVRNPDVFLFDEPLSNLDAALRHETRVEIAKLHTQLAATTIYVTHDQVEAMTLADKIVVLRDGRIEQVGSPIDLYERPDNAFVAQFIGSPKMNFFSDVDLAKDSAKVLGAAITANEEVGLRPEHLVPATKGAVVEGKLELVENLGEYALVHLVTHTGVEFIAKTEKPPAAAKGETIGFTIKPELAHRFDKATGKRK